jgi:DNA-binding helix-hairpin-helix protein with protein kinase domain
MDQMVEPPKPKRVHRRKPKPVQALVSVAAPPPPLLRIRAQTWNPQRFKELGRGGEAVVYKIRDDTVAKIFLLPNAPEYAESRDLQLAAISRIREMQTKLLRFPHELPAQVIAPTGVLENVMGQIFGFVMPYKTGASLEKFTRTTSKIRDKQILELLKSIHELVRDIHSKGVIIGDFNESNIIVDQLVPYLLDADSMQFGEYECRTFTPRFTDPNILRVDNGQFTLKAQHTQLSDWYSYFVIAMRLMTYTEPFGGVARNMTLAERIKERVSIFDNRVMYPAVAKPLGSVPRNWLEVFIKTFHLGERFAPPDALFDTQTATP